jgi:hypothetical protein
MPRLSIELEVHEALTALGAIQDKALEASRLAAISSGDEHEIADLSSKLLSRVATRIVDALYPDEPVARVTWDYDIVWEDRDGNPISDPHPSSGFPMSES